MTHPQTSDESQSTPIRVNKNDELREKIEQSVKESYHDGKWGTGSNGSTKPADVINWHTGNIMQLIQAHDDQLYEALEAESDTIKDTDLNNQGVTNDEYVLLSHIKNVMKKGK